MITSLDQLDLTKKYTYADYLTWRFKERVELIKGKIFKMSPAPNTKHQTLLGKLYIQIAQSLETNPCQIFLAPFDVRLRSANRDSYETVVQPDICIICDPEKIDEKGAKGAPDLIIEILSPSTSRKDMRDKYALYEENGVIEYWVVNTDGTLIQFVLHRGRYQQLGIHTLGDIVVAKGVSGLQVDLDKVFVI